MKALVLDSVTRKEADFLREAFARKQIEAAVCYTSNEFLTAVNANEFASIYIDMETWKKGRCIYEYLDVGAKLANKPAVFYNADEKFGGIVGRTPHEQDRILYKPSDVMTAIEEA